MKSILSIGHSNINWDEFHFALDQFDVNCIIDVRSSPTSRWPQFRGNALRSALNRKGISYVYAGDKLGGRPKHGPNSYSAMRGTTEFASGIETVLSIANRCRPALMCSEAEPLTCHRFLLISRHLNSIPDVGVWHIRHDGTLEGHEHAENRLLNQYRMTDDLLLSREELLAEAYVRQERKLG